MPKRSCRCCPIATSTMPTDRELAISPIVQESVQHNTKVFLPFERRLPGTAFLFSPLKLADGSPLQVISQLRSLTASLFGIACGILGLESYYGFGFYLLFTTFTSFLIWALMCKGKQGDYFQAPLSELWSGDLMGSALGFVLFWTAGYGIVRA